MNDHSITMSLLKSTVTYRTISVTTHIFFSSDSCIHFKKYFSCARGSPHNLRIKHKRLKHQILFQFYNIVNRNSACNSKPHQKQQNCPIRDGLWPKPLMLQEKNFVSQLITFAKSILELNMLSLMD